MAYQLKMGYNDTNNQFTVTWYQYSYLMLIIYTPGGTTWWWWYGLK